MYPQRLPKETFWGLFGQKACKTQQITIFQASVPIQVLPTRFSPQAPLTLIYMSHISHAVEESSSIQN